MAHAGRGQLCLLVKIKLSAEKLHLRREHQTKGVLVARTAVSPAALCPPLKSTERWARARRADGSFKVRLLMGKTWRGSITIEGTAARSVTHLQRPEEGCWPEARGMRGLMEGLPALYPSTRTSSSWGSTRAHLHAARAGGAGPQSAWLKPRPTGSQRVLLLPSTAQRTLRSGPWLTFVF